MGIDRNTLALYCQFAKDGLFGDVRSVVELGSQDIRASGYEGLISKLMLSLGKEALEQKELEKLSEGAAKTFYEALGFSYSCIDTDGRHNAIVMDLNFDSVKLSQLGKYQFVTNLGTTEHIFDQRNAFKVVHDLTSIDGLMFHVVPLQGNNFIDHCFYMYQSDFFTSIAKNNGYETLGMWLCSATEPSLVSWSGDTESANRLPPTDHRVVIVLLKKRYRTEFHIPYQSKYESTNTAENVARYNYVIDGEILNGLSVKRLSMPKWIEVFPRDLANPLTKHEGWHEDGWVNKNSIIYLPGGIADALVIRGLIPKIEDSDYAASLTVKIDGMVVAERAFGLGEWQIEAPIPPANEPRKVELMFSAAQRLPSPEDRIVASLVRTLGLLSAKRK